MAPLGRADLATTWIFVRGNDRRHIQRQDEQERPRLVVWGADLGEFVHEFDDQVDLVQYLTGIESDLIADGWSLAHFYPERRSGVDRRSTPRGPDRRQTPACSRGTLLPFNSKSPSKPEET